MASDISEKRCTVFPTSLDIEGELLEASSPMNYEHEEVQAPCGQPPRLQKRQKPPPLPVTVKRSSNESPGEVKRQETDFCQTGNPWQRYERFTQEGKSRSIYLAFEKSQTASMVAVKVCHNVTVNPTRSLVRTSHVNLVNLKAAFIDKEIVYLIYERVDLSLNHLHSCVSLKEAHIAAICKEVLQGLSYIHRELHIGHGEIRSSNVFVTLSGVIKIGTSLAAILP
ncbi:predicted protein [Histoplasma mississippiense (nom. inval.)]|uniref:predicted protein n=1 Tax=Ajellomyces capsulatus (strain NAm1 / WU24) TaxID=2059318 RepID=UPI000157CEE7|nr:predicted protein [Histoplasma mississippiense (nom. inval.)]EDN11150.1 predicted protein [Histoplasma mississippiense (nom. inval.)]